MNSKVLILNNENDENFKAILSLKKESQCAIKFFNLKQKYRNLALGIKQQSEIVKIPLKVEQGNCFFNCKNIDLDRDFTCAVVDVSNAFCPEILLCATGNNGMEIENIETAFVQHKPQDTSSLYVPDSQEQIENMIDDNLEDDISSTYYDACSKCKYREAFYKDGCSAPPPCSQEQKISQQESLTSEVRPSKNFQEKTIDSIQSCSDKQQPQTTISSLNGKENMSTINSIEPSSQAEIEELEEKKTFYEQIKSQVDALFEKYKADESLQALVPHSSWVQVTYDNNGGYYVLGLIKDENNTLKYIAYGMPSSDSSTPPEDLAEYAQWTPVGDNNGYWIVCQDATTGETMPHKLV